MIEAALKKARSRVRLARDAAELMREQGRSPQFDDQWINFLVHWKGAYTKLQQAAKETPQDMQWFGAVNTERKKDPLLRWLYEARNDEEHGIVTSAVHREEKYILDPKGGTLHISGVEHGADGKVRFLAPDGSEVEAEHLPEESSLAEVTEYDGIRKVPPPTSHLGKPFDGTPIIAALLGVSWLEVKMQEAERLHRASR